MKKKLSVGDVGDDVATVHKLLESHGFSVPAAEVERTFFGPGTRAALGEFQRTKGISESCEVCEKTAVVLAAVPSGLAQPVEERPQSASAPFRKGLATGSAVGSTVGPGSLRPATEAQFLVRGQVDQRGNPFADGFVKISSQGPSGEQVIGKSPLNVPAEVTINLEVAPKTEPEPSEYENLLAKLAPLLRNAQLAELTVKDIVSLAEEAGLEKQRIDLLVLCARLSIEANLPSAVFYGLARRDHLLNLEQLLELDPAEVRTSLETSIKTNIIPASVSADSGNIMRRFEALRQKRVSIEKLAETVGVTISSTLKKALEEVGIRTLVDVRNAGGVGRLEGLTGAQLVYRFIKSFTIKF